MISILLTSQLKIIEKVLPLVQMTCFNWRKMVTPICMTSLLYLYKIVVGTSYEKSVKQVAFSFQLNTLGKFHSTMTGFKWNSLTVHWREEKQLGALCHMISRPDLVHPDQK